MNRREFVVSAGATSLGALGRSRMAGAQAGQSEAPGRGSRTQAPGTKTETVTYTCSMHPEVNRSSPGKCPKCGMDLVRKQ